VLTNIGRRIELIANVAIIIVSCLLGIVLVRNHLVNRQTQPPNERQSDTQPMNGAKVTSLDVDWEKNGRTLILAISSSCHFCTESAPFYKKLIENKRDARLVAVFPQSVDEGLQYLAKLGVSVDEVKQASLSAINVRGTPTLILVNSDGVIVNEWFGKLAPQEESLVLTALRKEE